MRKHWLIGLLLSVWMAVVSLAVSVGMLWLFDEMVDFIPGVMDGWWPTADS